MVQLGKLGSKARQAWGYLKFKISGATGDRRAQASGAEDMAAGKLDETARSAKDPINRSTH